MIYNAVDGEPEFRIYFSDHNAEYMMIRYAGRVTFQRCGAANGSGEMTFGSLDSLLAAETIDELCLGRDWNKITDIIMDDRYSLFDKDDLHSLCGGLDIPDFV
jgi:hypothetical protein